MIISLFRILLIFPVLVFCAEKNTQCITPNGENASCIPLSSCGVIQEAVLTLNDSALQFARNSRCGFDIEPLMCCGSTAFSTVSSADPPKSSLLPDRSTCGYSLADDRIYGGELTAIGEFPWMALLGYKNGDDGTSAGFKCGGSLINNRYVLTAAHCVRLNPTVGFTLDTVRLGEWQISSEIDCEERILDECADPVLDLKIEKEVVHRSYGRKSGDNDIALLRLEHSVQYTDYIRPICLPSFNAAKPQASTELVVSGWGAIENGSSSDIKLKVTVLLVPNDDCKARIKNRGKVGENQLCAGGAKGKDACQGDSGGPLMGKYENTVDMKDQWYQEGVIAWGIGCGLNGVPGVYTKIGKYLDWILNNMSEF